MSINQARPSILVVDDELLIQKSMIRSLRRMYELTAVSSAAEAYQAMHEYDYDLIICDLVMPRCDGMELFELLSAASSRMAERMVFMTGDTHDLHVNQLVKSEPHKVLFKPFSIEELETFVTDALQTLAQTSSSERSA